jgi:polysaccharide biosynthesis transport protein
MSDLNNSASGPGKDLILHGRAVPQTSRVLYLEPVEAAPGPSPAPSDLLDYWMLIRGRKWLLAALTLAGALAGAVFALQQVPLYRARTTLELQSPMDGSAVFGTATHSSDGVTPEAYLQTQVKVLESNMVDSRVREKLQKQDRKRIPVISDPLTRLQKRLGLKVSEPAPVAGILPDINTEVKALTNSRIIEIQCESPDAEFAAEFANMLAAEYKASNLEARWQAMQQSTDWLGRQLEEFRVKLERSENQLLRYSRDSGLTFTNTSNHTIVDEEKLRQLQEELSRAEADRVVRQSTNEVASRSSAEAVPQVLDNGRLSGYQARLAELRRELAELKSIYKAPHIKIQRVQAQITELETTLHDERDAILTRIRNDYEAAIRRERLLKSAYDKQLQVVGEKSGRAISYGILKREVDTNRHLYDELLQKVKQVNISSALQVSNARIVDIAETPSTPFRPNLKHNLALGLASGLLIGLVVVVGGERFNRSIRAPGETPFHLKLPELGVIPSSSSAAENGSAWNKTLSIWNETRNVQPNDGNSVALATWQEQPSIMAESFRSALTSILASKPGQNRPKVILTTSSGCGEGKSTTVSNLGIALAEINQRVLLLDADMRKPNLHRIFNLSNSWGLSDLLREKRPLREYSIDDLARKTEIEGLYVLPSGPGTASISNLLYSGRMTELVRRVSEEFDTVLIDTPPMLYLPDARVLGRLADAAILVIRAGLTTRDAALSAKHRLVEDGIFVIGTILNGWDLKSKGRYGYYTYPYTYTRLES